MSSSPDLDGSWGWASPPSSKIHEAGLRFAVGTSDGRLRDPFPLPLLSSVAGAAPSSKQSRARLKSRLSVNQRVRDTAWALNQLSCGLPRRGGHLPVDGLEIADIRSAPRQSQRVALQELRRHVINDPVPDCLPAPKSALRELMRSADGGYNPGGRGMVGGFFEGGPSLPAEPGKPATWRSSCLRNGEQCSLLKTC